MAVEPRADVVALPDYVAGRATHAAIKLANNEVPARPVPDPIAAAMAAACAEPHRYPDIGGAALIDGLAHVYRLPADRIAVGCGSVALCQQLIQAMCSPGDEVVYGWRSFEAYPVLARIAMATAVPVPLDRAYVHDLDAMLDAITPQTRIVFVCNPNNPTGTAVRREQLLCFLGRVPPTVVVALDEAYREFVTDPDVLDGFQAMRHRDNVVVLRTFSKAYGLAALRVGYLAGPEAVVRAVRKVGIPFSVNGVAQAAALAALEARSAMTERCTRITAERDRVQGELRTLGYAVPDSHANFVWLPLGGRTAEFVSHAAAAGLDVRGFPPDGVRVTIGTAPENNRFLGVAGFFRAVDRCGP